MAWVGLKTLMKVMNHGFKPFMPRLREREVSKLKGDTWDDDNGSVVDHCVGKGGGV